MPQPDAVVAPGGIPSRLRTALSIGVDRGTRATLWAAERPVAVLAVLVVVQWLALLAFALTVKHNGLVYYQGGDQIGLTTSAWLLAHGSLPPTVLGFGWPFLLLPFGWLVPSDYVAFLPFVIGLNALVLAPIALACVYALAARIGGRVLGLWAAALWVAAPYLAIPFFRDDYHERYVEQFLPQALGLTALADYPSMVCLLIAAYLAVRALDATDPAHAVLAGLVTGFALAIKPANILFLAGPAMLLLLARRPRLGIPFTLGILPSLLLLALWKQRGLGSIPLFGLDETRTAASATLGAVDLDRYLDLDWATLRRNMANLREFFWSVRVLQWLPFAGAFAVARRSVPLSGLLAAWFAGFLLIKGSSAQASVESGSFFRLLMPAYPAYFLLAVALPLLVPGLARGVSPRRSPAAPHRLSRQTLVAVACILVVLPALAIATPSPLSSENPASITIGPIITPVDSSIDVSIVADGAKRTLTWSHRDFGSTKVFYRVFRTAAGGEDYSCLDAGSPDCRLQLLTLASTRAQTFVDLSPPADALYRIGIATNWQNDAAGGDVIGLSRPIPASG